MMKSHSDRRKAWLIRFFCLFFALSVSGAVLPCGFTNARGIFGQITASSAAESETRQAQETSIKRYKRQHIQRIFVYNPLLALGICVIVYALSMYPRRLPRGETIITLKVRMDD